MKKIMFEAYGRNIPVKLKKTHYYAENAMAVSINSCEENNEEPLGVLSVNLSESKNLPENCAFVRTTIGGNNDVLNWIIKNNIGVLLGLSVKVGSTVYPAVKFNF